MGEQINGVIARDRDRHLEFARHEGVAIQRFIADAAEHLPLLLLFFDPAGQHRGADLVALLAIHPEFEIHPCGGFGCQQIGNVVSQAAGDGIAVLPEGGRRGHHIAVDITHAARVEPMLRTIVPTTVRRSSFGMPCSWKAWRVVARMLPLPY